MTGVEATLLHEFDERWSGKASIDYRSPKNEDNGRYIPYRDRFKATAEMTFAATDSLDLTAKLLYSGARYSDAANTTKLPEYTTVDFVANHTLDENSSLKLSVENLFNQQYSTNTNYRAPGRTFALSFTRIF